MEALAEYRILSVPRFEREEIDIRLFDSFVGQRALWSHIALLLVRDCGVTAEFRITHFDRVRLSLRLHGEPSAKIRGRINQAEALLPSGYRWRRAEPDSRIDALPLRMARIVRRIEFVDLPVPSPDLDRGESGPTFEGVDAAPEEGESLRHIPTLDSDPGELMTERFCIPIPGAIDTLKPRTRVLFQEVQRARDTVLSICLHPLDPDEILYNQIHALGWKRFLDPFAGQLANVGLGDARALHAAYDRFTLPPGYLAHVSLRVGGASDPAVVGLANTVASCFGGIRAFQVHAPSREVPGQRLVLPDIDVPVRWTARQRTRQHRLLARELLEAGIEYREIEEMFDFILRVPHLFTLQEAEELLRLPAADEEGLPAFESEAIPPFTTPSLSLHPVLGESGPCPPPADRLRLGMMPAPAAASALETQPLASFGWHSIEPVDLTKHAFIVGGTGSGKTMSTLFLVRELARLKVPLMVIEPVKTEYFGRLGKKVPKLLRRRFESAKDGKPANDFLAFDPLRVPKGMSVARHASYLKSCFEAAFPMEPVIALLVDKGLLEYYTAPAAVGGCGFGKFQRGGPQLGSVRKGLTGKPRVFPSYRTFQEFLLGPFLKKEFPQETAGGQSRVAEIRDVFRRRFENLGAGILGTAFERADLLYRMSAARNAGVPDPRFYELREGLLVTSTVIELDAIPDADQKALAMAFLMTYLFEYRQAEDLAAREDGRTLPRGLRHFLILEEAHRLLAGGGGGRGGETVGESAQAKSIGLFVDMLAEIRAFGQGLAIVEQIPSKIVPEAVKNTNLKIMLRLPAQDDRDYLGAAMNFTDAQKRYVAALKVDKAGEHEPGRINYVLFEEGVEQPLLLSLPLPAKSAAVDEGWVYDELFPEA